MSRKYEEGLYRRYVATGTAYDSENDVGITSWYEYDRDEPAERAVAAWEKVEAAVARFVPPPIVINLRQAADAVALTGIYGDHSRVGGHDMSRMLEAIADTIKEALR